MTPEQFIRSAPWRFAKTMPDQPHEYTVRGETPDGEFNSFVLYIREHGHRAEYGGRFYTYLEVDAWRYWTMGAPVESTTVINRAEVSQEDAASRPLSKKECSVTNEKRDTTEADRVLEQAPHMHPAPPETYTDEAAEVTRVSFLPRRPKP